jgi:hypothetical protein
MSDAYNTRRIVTYRRDANLVVFNYDLYMA